ncbi:MAG: carbohydrate-binding domain-containing protein [Oscillospiraceae bacterium]|nr:MAG: carbohydrate-binding domain-containing protein [Oscillospiraceae bacterium]
MRGKILPRYSDGCGGYEKHAVGHGKNNSDNHTENENAENAVIKCKDGAQLTVNGDGEIIINASGKNGIKTGGADEDNASRLVLEGNLDITAVNDAVNAGGELIINSGTLKINAKDDALHSDTVLTVGQIGTDGPVISISACCEGLEAVSVTVNSGTLEVSATDDCINAANKELSGGEFSITINGGTLKMYTSSGDGFDSNGDITITGGFISLWSANSADNQPLDADGTVTVSGGTVIAGGGGSGMGMKLTADQPCVIFALSGAGGRPGGSGGFPGGNNDGDKGGFRPGGSKGDQGGFPQGGTSGQGGASGSAQPPAKQDESSGEAQANGPSGSAQGSLIAQGSTLTLRDEDGNTLITATAVCQSGYIMLSSPELEAGKSYSLYAEDTLIGTQSAVSGQNASSGSGGSGGFNPGQPPQDGRSPSSADEQPNQNESTQSANLVWIIVFSVLAAAAIGAAAAAFICLRSKKKAEKNTNTPPQNGERAPAPTEATPASDKPKNTAGDDEKQKGSGSEQ